MVQELFGKLNSFKRNARVIKAHAPKLFAGIAIALLTTTSIIGSNFNPLRAEATAMNHKDANAVVVCAYKGFLNRAPEPAGKEHWKKYYVSSGYNAEKLGANILKSKEGQFVAYVTTFDSFIQRTYQSCLKRSASTSEVATWRNIHLKGTSRQAIFAFIVVAGDKPWLFPKEEACKRYDKAAGSVRPICKAGSAGTHRDVVIVNVPESNIYVNKAWSQNIINLRFAAAQSRFYLEAYQDPRVPYPAGSYRSDAAQAWLKAHGYPVARGVSMHQWGLAIDFKCNGVPLNRNAACLNWMRKNAPKYGVHGLASEPWHWSSNGR